MEFDGRVFVRRMAPAKLAAGPSRSDHAAHGLVHELAVMFAGPEIGSLRAVESLCEIPRAGLHRPVA
ncbi:hypothetical protein SAMN05216338_10789 [Bradyrhizobium sp. Rc2d]|nr:hypothetical protein SAMN05216338_10789 [Bradyrhizobium sp. Rc2d]